jgi:hypothetical protein
MPYGESSRCIDPHDRIDFLQEQIDDIGGGTTIDFYEEGVFVVTASALNVVGAIATVTNVAGVATLTIAGTAGSQNVFESFAVSAGTGTATGGPIVADTTTDTATFIAGDNIDLIASAGADQITISVAGIHAFKTIAVSGQSDVVADSVNDTLTLVAGSNITLTTSAGGDSVTIAASGGGSGHNGVRGTLDTDLTIDMDDVVVNVDGWVGSDPGATITAKNPLDNLHDDSPKYQFMGNAEGNCTATEYDDGWYLDYVQLPVVRPV